MAVQDDPHVSLVWPVTRTPEGLRGMPGAGVQVGSSAALPGLWPCRLLRLFPAPARSRPCLRGRAPHRAVVRAGRELALVLCRRNLCLNSAPNPALASVSRPLSSARISRRLLIRTGPIPAWMMPGSRRYPRWASAALRSRETSCSGRETGTAAFSSSWPGKWLPSRGTGRRRCTSSASTVTAEATSIARGRRPVHGTGRRRGARSCRRRGPADRRTAGPGGAGPFRIHRRGTLHQLARRHG